MTYQCGVCGRWVNRPHRCAEPDPTASIAVIKKRKRRPGLEDIEEAVTAGEWKRLTGYDPTTRTYRAS